MQSHPAWRGKPIARDSSSDRPHPPRRDENVLAANCRTALASSDTFGKHPVPFPGCIPWQGCDEAIRVESRVSRCQCLSKAMAEDTKANHLRFWTSFKISAKLE